MSVVNGQIANQTTFNNAFLSRTAPTTSTVAKVALQNADVESGASIANAQRAINKAFEGIGATGEADTTINDYSSNNYISNGDSRKTAVGKLDAQIKTTQDDLDLAEAEIVSHENRLDDLELADMNIGGNKTFTGNMAVQGNFEVQGTTTSVNSTDLEVEDQNITVNKGGSDGSAEGAGIDIERPLGNAAIRFDSTLPSMFKIGLVSALYEIIVSGVAQTISGIKDFVSGIKVDTVSESTLDAGVTVDGVLIKDGLVDGRDVDADGTYLDTVASDITAHDGRLDDLESNNMTIGGEKTFSSPTHLNDADINGALSLIEQSNAQAGALVKLTGLTKTAINLTGALTSIESITAPAASMVKILTNITGGDILVKDETGTAAADRIRTGTGADVTFKNNQFAVLFYDIALARWMIASLGGSAAASNPLQTVDYKLNREYSLLGALNGFDGIWVAPENCEIINAFAYVLTAGSSGTTTLDIKIKPFGSGSFTSIFLTPPSITSASGDSAWVGVGDTVSGCTAPVLSSNPFAVAAKSALRLDLTAAQVGGRNAGLILVYRKV